jgi:hypothetical protein
MQLNLRRVIEPSDKILPIEWRIENFLVGCSSGWMKELHIDRGLSDELFRAPQVDDVGY